MKRKTIYLASPYGFSDQLRQKLLPVFVSALEEIGATVWEPFQRNSQVNFSQSGWAHKVAIANLQDVKSADGFFGVVNGAPPDEGVMIELGAAIALKKPTFLFRDDFRRSSDSDDYPLNLMIFAGLPANGWENYYYKTIEEIKDPKKELYQWLKN